MFRKILAVVFGFVSSKVKSATPTQIKGEDTPTTKNEPAPRKPFIFQETLEAWRAAVDQLPKEYAERKARHQEEWSRLDTEIQHIKAQLTSEPRTASEEHKRRELIERHNQLFSLRDKEEYAVKYSNKYQEDVFENYVGQHGNGGRLEKEFRQAETRRIVQSGAVLCQDVIQEGRVSGRTVITGCDEYRPTSLDRRERILVIHEGRPYVGEIVFEAVFTTENTRHSGMGGEMAHDICEWVFEGRYNDLRVKWISPSLAQFKRDELLVLRAYEFAELKHRGQFRAGEKKLPYITHPLAVAAMVAQASGSAETICATLLHDVMEDCGVKDEEILDLYPQDASFGQRVLSIVKEVTDPEGLPYEQKKERQIAMMASGYSNEAALLKAADQTCNMQDLVATPPNWGKGEEEAYIASMKKLVDARTSVDQRIKALFDKAHQEACRFYDIAS